MNDEMLTREQVDDERDREHLKLLGIFHYVSAALSSMICLVGGIYGGILMFAAQAAREAAAEMPPEAQQMADTIGPMLIGVVSVVGCFGLLRVLLSAWAGWSLMNHRNKMVIYIASALDLLNIPYGTLLGIFTFIVLGRPNVERIFRQGEP